MKIGKIYNELLLTEEITSGRVIVYHRTGKKGSPIKGIASDGYRVSTGAFYGVGIYTTYDFQSQFGERMKNIYGDIIIESKILSMDKFLIFDYDVAKKIYGNKNYTLDNQLRLILGNDWNIYKNNWFMNGLINNIGKTKYTSTIAKDFYEEFKEEITPKLRGMVFTGAKDGKVLVSYDRKNVEPLRYTMDEGETWENVLNKDIYKRMQTYEPDKIDLDKEHFRNRFETNKLIPSDIDRILSSDELFNKLNSDGIYYLLRNANDINAVINRILSSDELIDKLSSDGIEYLLKNAKDKDAVINRLLSSTELINNLDSGGINTLFYFTKDKESFINMILSSDELINKLDNKGMENLLRNAKDKESVINRLLSSNELINNFGSSKIQILLIFAKDKESVINRLLSSDELINKLNSNGINFLLYDAKDKEFVINRLLSSNELINKFDYHDIFNLLEFAKDKESVINRLLKSGVSKDKINNGISKYNSFNSNNTLSLIPEGYKNKIKKLLRNI